MIPIDLEPTREELEKELLKMPDLEDTTIPFEKYKEAEEEVQIQEKHDHLDIQSSMVYKNSFCLGGMNEEDEYITIWFDSFKFLEHVDKERLEEIKEKLVKYIEEK